jgi:hypothetical protein
VDRTRVFDYERAGIRVNEDIDKDPVVVLGCPTYSRGFSSCQVRCAFTVGHSLAMML